MRIWAQNPKLYLVMTSSKKVEESYEEVDVVGGIIGDGSSGCRAGHSTGRPA
jgi:hypothetical protein